MSSSSVPTSVSLSVPIPLRASGALLVAAFSWGVIWYPYRLLEQAGIVGALSTLVTYLVGLALALPFLYRWIWPVSGKWLLLSLMALASGVTNLAYVLAVIDGQVIRVLLLFYLAPLWTLILARLILKEQPGRFGYPVMILSLTGAWVMLWGDETGLPVPASVAEWLGLSAGIGFALANVLTRRLGEVAMGTRVLWVFLGVVAVSVLPAFGSADVGMVIGRLNPWDWLLLGATGLALVVATLTVQYGVAHIPANRAVVILLTELIWAALSSWWLAGEAMGAREWLGGAMIVSATLLTMRMEKHHV